jgi:hypothetical protein
MQKLRQRMRFRVFSVKGPRIKAVYYTVVFVATQFDPLSPYANFTCIDLPTQ